ncbi:hypothetical protein [Microbulbifer sp. SAOS-129_SWC]|uniref:hypothetical protein n=1 Tax=Microbulbifer sp. SAOS-129_SWC TaxID=3145235 RepID=UPI003217C30E
MRYHRYRSPLSLFDLVPLQTITGAACLDRTPTGDTATGSAVVPPQLRYSSTAQ